MKGKYINIQVRRACLSGSISIKQDIHAQLAETIAERRRILQQLENISGSAKVIDVYLANMRVA